MHLVINDRSLTNLQNVLEEIFLNRLHVRRTDKTKIQIERTRPKRIEAYFQEILAFQNKSNFVQEKTPILFIASDDHTVLDEARKT